MNIRMNFLKSCLCVLTPHAMMKVKTCMSETSIEAFIVGIRKWSWLAWDTPMSFAFNQYSIIVWLMITYCSYLTFTLYIYSCGANWITLAQVGKKDSKNAFACMKNSYYFCRPPWGSLLVFKTLLCMHCKTELQLLYAFKVIMLDLKYIWNNECS